MEKGIYQHFKGGIYRLLGTARHSETLEEMVVYCAMDGNDLWVRPASMWQELVLHNGKTMSRFSLIQADALPEHQ